MLLHALIYYFSIVLLRWAHVNVTLVECTQINSSWLVVIRSLNESLATIPILIKFIIISYRCLFAILFLLLVRYWIWL